MNHYNLEPANFADYRDFLKQRYTSIKNQGHKISLQILVRRSKISKSHLQFLFNKKRHISLDKLPGLATALKLTETEEYFVYLMVCENSSKNPTIQTHFRPTAAVYVGNFFLTMARLKAEDR